MLIDTLYNNLKISHDDKINKAVPKRMAEYLAGRVSARIATLLLSDSEENISIGANGEPIWPDDVAGSISHTDQHAACIATSNNDLMVGVDIQSPLKASEIEAIKTSVLNEREELILQKIHYDPGYSLAVGLSTKETLYKALQPVCNQYIDFSEFEISRVILNRFVELRPTRQNLLPVSLRKNWSIDYSICRQFVLTKMSVLYGSQ